MHIVSIQGFVFFVPQIDIICIFDLGDSFYLTAYLDETYEKQLTISPTISK